MKILFAGLLVLLPTLALAEMETLTIIGPRLEDNSITGAQAEEFIRRNSGKGVRGSSSGGAAPNPPTKADIQNKSERSKERAREHAKKSQKYANFWKRFLRVATVLDGLDVAVSTSIKLDFKLERFDGKTMSGSLGTQGSIEIRADDIKKSEKPLFIPEGGGQIYPEGKNDDVCSPEAWVVNSDVQCAYYSIMPLHQGGYWFSIKLVDKLTPSGGISSADSAYYTFYGETPSELRLVIERILQP